VVDRVWNFSRVPGPLPLPVLERVRDELLEYPGAGASILEISYRSPCRSQRSVGGIRASIYTAVPLEAVRALRSFMVRFRTATP
jgi:phosphoserine aminotransferase